MKKFYLLRTSARLHVRPHCSTNLLEKKFFDLVIKSSIILEPRALLFSACMASRWKSSGKACDESRSDWLQGETIRPLTIGRCCHPTQTMFSECFLTLVDLLHFRKSLVHTKYGDGSTKFHSDFLNKLWKTETEPKGLFSSVSSPFYRVCMGFRASVAVASLAWTKLAGQAF